MGRLTSSDIAGYLDAEAHCAGWSGQAFPRKLEGKPRDKCPDPLTNLQESIVQGPEVGKFGRESLLKAVTFACEAVMSCEDQLNTMDSGSGDSDCGTTLKRGAEALLNAVKKDPTFASKPSLVFHLISKVAETDMGGSSGAMYSLLFEAAAGIIETAQDITANLVGKAFSTGISAMVKYGHAQAGDRTMLEALISALTALESATCAAEEGAKATLNMKASAGRASYVPVSELKHPDPGAHAIGITMRAIFEGFKIKANEMGMN